MKFPITSDVVPPITEKERRTALVRRAAKELLERTYKTKAEAAESIIVEYWGSFASSSKANKIIGLVRRIRSEVNTIKSTSFMP